MSDVMFPGRFRELANFYTTGRPTYPRLLARRVAHLVGLDGSQAVLDLGTAPGFWRSISIRSPARSSALIRNRKC